jgi:hypothetical protein
MRELSTEPGHDVSASQPVADAHANPPFQANLPAGALSDPLAGLPPGDTWGPAEPRSPTSNSWASDPGSLVAGLIPPRPDAPVSADELSSLAGPVTLTPTRDGGAVSQTHNFDAVIAPDGSVKFIDHPNLQYTGVGPFVSDPDSPPSGLGVGFSFDLTDAAMRAHGDDPYAAQKRDFLAQTQAAREAMAAANEKQSMSRSLVDLPTTLASMWGNTAQPIATRRRQLFLLWDACSEGDDGDATVASGGRAARTEILAFINQHLPAGSPQAYPSAELTALNQSRTSTAVFQPYGPSALQAANAP